MIAITLDIYFPNCLYPSGEGGGAGGGVNSHFIECIPYAPPRGDTHLVPNRECL